MIRTRVENILRQCFQKGVEYGFWSAEARSLVKLEVPKLEMHGDFSSNLPLVIAGKEKQKPRQMAILLAGLLREHVDTLKRVEIAEPGFVNIFVDDAHWQSVASIICEGGGRFGYSRVGRGRKVLVEFVSANPTGPLSVGHGRQAVLGDAVARLLEAADHVVTREYYYNDGGRQMRVLGESTRARYLELLGLPFHFPEDGYQGSYIRDIAQMLVDERGDSLKDESAVTLFKEKAESVIFKDIKKTLKGLGIEFDSYFNEHSLYTDGQLDEVVSILREKGLVYDQDGAVWFKTTAFGHDKDRVIIKNTGEPTYRLPDIAYHREKFRRGFDWMVNIFGSDHIATIPDVLAGVRALGYDDSKVTTVIHQFVTLTREGKQVKMSTRKATFVTVDELLEEVGPDVVRFFFLMRRADSQLEFDLDLAKKESHENPVYYVQYAYARLSSLHNQMKERYGEEMSFAEAPCFLLVEPEEIYMLKMLASFPRTVEGAALDLEPHRMIFYLLDLVGLFHSYYGKYRIISADENLTMARLCLAEALRLVIGTGLSIVGVSAPKTM